VRLGFFFTKSTVNAGFCDFFQRTHACLHVTVTHIILAYKKYVSTKYHCIVIELLKTRLIMTS